MLFNALVFTLRPKVDIIWTRDVRPARAQSVQLSKIAKKLNTDLCQFFPIERKHCSYENHEIKKGVTVLVFAVELRMCAPNAFPPIFERTGATSVVVGREH